MQLSPVKIVANPDGSLARAAATAQSLAEEQAQTLEKKGLGRLTGVRINLEANEEETAYARKRK